MTPDDLAKILDELGSRLGPAGQAAWTTMVTQKANEAHAWIGFYTSLSNIAIGLMAFLFFGSILVFFFERYGPAKPHYSSEDDLSGAVIGLLTLIGFGWAFCQFQLIATGLQSQNPSYYALRELLAAVHP